MGCPDCQRFGRRSAFTVLSETGTVAAEGWDANGRHVNLVGPPTTTYRCQHGHKWTEEGRRQIRQRGGVDPTGVVVAGAPIVGNQHLLRALSLPIVTQPVRGSGIRQQLNVLVTPLRQGFKRLLTSMVGRPQVHTWQLGEAPQPAEQASGPFDDMRARSLSWVPVSRRTRTFELRSGRDVVGRLRVIRGSLADAEMAAHQWTFRRQGFWHTRVTAGIPGSDAEVALFRPSWTGGGSLELSGGRILRLSPVSLLRSEWTWQESNQEPLVHIRGPKGLLRARAQVNISPNAVRDPDMPLLVALGWYLIVL